MGSCPSLASCGTPSHRGVRCRVSPLATAELMGRAAIQVVAAVPNAETSGGNRATWGAQILTHHQRAAAHWPPWNSEAWSADVPRACLVNVVVLGRYQTYYCRVTTEDGAFWNQLMTRRGSIRASAHYILFCVIITDCHGLQQMEAAYPSRLA